MSLKSSENVLSKVTDMVSNVYYHSIREMSELYGYGYSRGICHVYIRDLGGSRSKNYLIILTLLLGAASRCVDA